MATTQVLYIGEVNLQQPEEYYEASMPFDNREVQVDLNFEGEPLEPVQLDIVNQFLKQLPQLDAACRQIIAEDYEDADGDTARTYVQHHLEELSAEAKAALLGADEEDEATALLGKLHLVRIGFYPDDEENFAMLDYSIGTELTQYLIVLGVSANGDIAYLTMES